MYYCKDCGYEFDRPLITTEKHGFSSPPFEDLASCPLCRSFNFYERVHTHCRCCGAKLKPNSESNYCSDACLKKGMELTAREKRRIKYISESSLYETVRLCDKYNKENNTKLSYGQFVALVLPKMKGKKKNARKKDKTS